MKKSIIIALALILLAGSGIAFAEYGSGIKLLGLNAETEEMEEENNDEERSPVAEAVHEALSGDPDITPEDEEAFGEAVSERAKDPDIDLGKEVSEAARGAGNDNDENNDEERSPVAEAVHEALSGDPDITPEDEEAFGEAVSERARTMGAELGRIVSEAARGAAASNR
ncbi:MAG: hypothetical protein ACQESO_06985 [Bacillota bacterium]